MYVACDRIFLAILIMPLRKKLVSLEAEYNYHECSCEIYWPETPFAEAVEEEEIFHLLSTCPV